MMIAASNAYIMATRSVCPMAMAKAQAAGKSCPKAMESPMSRASLTAMASPSAKGKYEGICTSKEKDKDKHNNNDAEEAMHTDNDTDKNSDTDRRRSSF